MSEAAKDVVYLRKFVRGLEPKIEKAPTVLSTDNKAARDLSYNAEHHNRSKHIERRHSYIRDMVEAQEIIVPLVGTTPFPRSSDQLVRESASTRRGTRARQRPDEAEEGIRRAAEVCA